MNDPTRRRTAFRPGLNLTLTPPRPAFRPGRGGVPIHVFTTKALVIYISKRNLSDPTIPPKKLPKCKPTLMAIG